MKIRVIRDIDVNHLATIRRGPMIATRSAGKRSDAGGEIRNHLSRKTNTEERENIEYKWNMLLREEMEPERQGKSGMMFRMYVILINVHNYYYEFNSHTIPVGALLFTPH